MSDWWVKVDKTLRHHAQGGLQALRALAWPLLRQPAAPVFVVGCSRAGTTLVYKTLSESPELGSLQRETHDYWAGLHPPSETGWQTHAIAPEQANPDEANRVARDFFVGTGRHHWVDKNNQNGLSVPYLLGLFPRARFVYVKRAPGDNINSLIEGWNKPEEFATWSDRLPGSVAIDGGRIQRWCFFLAAGWEALRAAPLAQVAAFQYRAMNDAILSAREAVPASQWAEVHYEDLVTDPVEEFRRLFRDCALEFDAATEHHCRRVLERPYNAFSPIGLEKWRSGPHAPAIEAVLPEVGAVAGRMGYPADAA